MQQQEQESAAGAKICSQFGPRFVNDEVKPAPPLETRWPSTFFWAARAEGRHAAGPGFSGACCAQARLQRARAVRRVCQGMQAAPPARSPWLGVGSQDSIERLRLKIRSPPNGHSCRACCPPRGAPGLRDGAVGLQEAAATATRRAESGGAACSYAARSAAAHAQQLLNRLLPPAAHTGKAGAAQATAATPAPGDRAKHKQQQQQQQQKAPRISIVWDPARGYTPSNPRWLVDAAAWTPDSIPRQLLPEPPPLTVFKVRRSRPRAHVACTVLGMKALAATTSC